MNPIRAIRQLDAVGIDIGIVGDSLTLTGDTKALQSDLREKLSSRKRALRDDLNALRAPSLQAAPCEENCRFYLPSHGQQRLSFLDALYPESAAYIVAASVFFRGEVDLDRLVDALCRVARRQDALYTHLVRTDDIDLAATDKNLAVELPVLDLSDHPEPDAELASLREEISTTPFDLTNPPLWRWLMVRTGPESCELIVAIHHFISDGWSLAAAFLELAAEYRQPGEHKAKPAASYSQFARHQRKRLEQADIPAMIEDAQDALRDCQLESPGFGGKERPVLTSDRAGRTTFSLEPDVAEGIRSLAGQLSLTASSILSAMFALSVHRFTDSERFALGVAASNRPGSKFEKTFGFFVNWLAVPVDCGKQETLAAFIKRFHDDKLAAIDRVCIPFDEVARTSGARRTPFLHPVFQYMFVSHVPARAVSLPGMDISLTPLPNGRAKLDLTMFLTDSHAAVSVEGEGELFLELEYNAQLFDADTIQQFSEVFLSLTRKATEAHETTLADLTDAEALSIAHGPAKSAPLDLAAMFERVVARNPEAAAFAQSGQSRTYAELKSRALQIATGLGQLDLGDRPVGLLVRRSFDLPATLIGTAMTNAPFVTLDPDAPLRRNQQIISDAQPGVLLHSRQCAEDAAKLAPDSERFVIEDFGSEIEPLPASAEHPLDPERAAYLLYTSGSSGKPKGALIPNRAIANFTAWMGETLGLSIDDRVLAKTPCSFDAFLRETLASLCHGSCVTMVEDDQALDVSELVRVIEQNSVTVLHGTPTLYDSLLKAAAEHGGSPLKSLTRVMCGGEAMPRSLAQLHFATLPECRLFNVYGPTECTVDVTCREITQADDFTITLGQPIDNCTIVIADQDLNPVKQGSRGEILILGTPVGLGYHGAEASSAAAFLESCPQVADKRAYRTGDRGRMLASGEIEYLGRLDRQIKIRGMRIELNEVESQIAAHPSVAKCAVVASRSSGHDTELLAALELHPASEQDSSTLVRTLQTYLSDKLPIAMIPSFFAPIPTFPYNSHGKVDTGSLTAELERLRTRSAQTKVETLQLSEVQAELIGMAESLLERQGIGLQDNFFDLGGHSLNAIRLLNQANKRFGTRLTVKELFNEPTIATLAAAVEKSRSTVPDEGPTIQPIRRRRRQTTGAS